MGQIGMDISVEELRRQFRDAVEKLAEQRADLDQATQEVTRLREELKTTREWAENFAHTAADNGAARDRHKKELKEIRNTTEPFNAVSRKLCYDENEKLRAELKDAREKVEGLTGLRFSDRNVLAQRDRLKAELKEAREMFVVADDEARSTIDKLKAELENAEECCLQWTMKYTTLESERNRFREGLEKIKDEAEKDGLGGMVEHLGIIARQSLSQTRVIPKAEGESDD